MPSYLQKESFVLKEKLVMLDEKRKSGEVNFVEYYRGLMALVGELTHALQDEKISDRDVKKQIPLLKAFLIDQMDKMEGRGN